MPDFASNLSFKIANASDGGGGDGGGGDGGGGDGGGGDGTDGNDHDGRDRDHDGRDRDHDGRDRDHDGRDRDHDDDHDDRTKIIKKYYRDDDDDGDNDVADLGAYNMGYRDGRFDKLSNVPFSDISPFGDKDAETWYKIGYSVGWNSIVGDSPLIIK
jgi:hypothetical protein